MSIAVAALVIFGGLSFVAGGLFAIATAIRDRTDYRLKIESVDVRFTQTAPAPVPSTGPTPKEK